MLTSALDAFREGILVLDDHQLIIHHNAKAKTVLQTGEDSLVGQSIYTVLRQDSLPAPARSLDQPSLPWSVPFSIGTKHHWT